MTSPGAGGTRLSMHGAMHGQTGLMPPGAEFTMSAAVSPLPSRSYNMHAAGDSSSDSRSPEMPSPRASDRESRIVAEKQRRIQYNSQITQITGLLPDVVHPQRKIDKTSVLRLAANKLRNEHVFGDTIKCPHVERWSAAFLRYFEILGGFLLAVTCRGRIFNISPNVQKTLGHCPVDLLGQDVYNYIHPDDKEILHEHIYPQELQSGCDKRLFEKYHSFHVRIKRSGAKSDTPRYEQCVIDGSHRRSDRATSNGVQDEQIIRRQRVRHNRTFSSSGNDFVFIGFVCVLSDPMPPQILSPTSDSEYWTRHLIDGQIVQCSQSISLAVGYMTQEVTGASAFSFMHKEDVRWVMCVLKLMYDESKEFGESYYRLMSRSGHFIYMRTRGFLEIDKRSKKVQSFVCVNNVIGEKDGKRLIEEMKRKYSVLCDKGNKEDDKVSTDDVALEDPQTLEHIVVGLVESSNETVEQLKLVAPSKENIISAIKNSEKVVQDTGVRFESRKRRKTDYDDESEQLKRLSKLQH